MRVHHRIPSIFTLSMVDVMCCALGCVILLWLINLREAKHHEESAEEQHREITAQLDTIRADRDAAIDMLIQLQARIDATEEEKNDLQKRLSSDRAEAADLSRRLKASAGRVAALQSKMTESEKRGDKETARARELSEELSAARRRLKESQATADLVPSLRTDLKEARAQYAAEKALAGALETEIARRLREMKDAGKTLDDLQATRRALQSDVESRDRELTQAKRSLTALEGETARVRAAADNRFAGIALTGRRVVFLVDMSGSMDLVDENTPAPTKWTDVRNTVARLMRSMPDLEKFQVIVFAEQAEVLFKGDGDWTDYDAASSPERVLRGLAAIKPKGGTNMYAALQTAFRMRDRGMDTIYLLSDGLPNLGEGINAATLTATKESERNDLLARHIRKTLRAEWNRALLGRPRVRINAIGFFYESPEVGAFLWALARENDGSFVGMSKP